MKNIKKLYPDYFGWGLLFLFAICLNLILLWFIHHGVNLEKEYRFDLQGYSLAFVAGILFLWDIYEIWILVQFLRIELGRKIEFDEVTKTLLIYCREKTEILRINDLQEVVFSGPRFNSRTLTQHLSYSQLNFKSREPLIITSFVLNTSKLKKLLGNGLYRKTELDRGLFEGIRKK
ncbi:hypothetical protein GCM10028791_18300 [Echinicola sediminis]